MDKKEFKKTVNECFKINGFKQIKNKVFMELDEIIVEVYLDKTAYGNEFYYLYLRSYIKNIHLDFNYDKLPKEWDHSIRFLENDQLLRLHYLDLSNQELKELLIPLIIKYVEPIKKEGLKYLMKLNPFHFNPTARKFLNIRVE